MDHLILPRNPIGPLIDVPALSLIYYDGGDYATYPEREGWGPRPVAQWQAVFQHPTPEFKAFLQRWLYYGFAWVMFAKINIPDMTAVNPKSQSKHPFIRTRSLEAWMRNIISQRKYTLQMAKAFQVCGDIQFFLRETWENKRTSTSALARSESLLVFIKVERPKNPLDPNILVSISLLWELALSSTEYDEETNRHEASLVKIPVLPEYVLRSLLAKAGWCPSETCMLLEGLTTSGIIFMLNLERPRPRESHETSLEQEDSQRPPSNQCTQISCRHRNLSLDDYKTRHADGCLGCQDLVADISTLADVLLSGNIPLISMGRSNDEREQLSIEPWSTSTPYIAISHVWSDGLGNLQRNALPTCQFNRICDLARSLPLKNSKSCLIWIDTLCVPPDSANCDQAQMAALGKMRQTYENATGVLVLDSWLTSCDSSGLSQGEILMRIFHTTWNRRLWTYQEGAIAKLLFFQFQDSVVEIDTFYKEFLQDREIIFDLTLKKALSRKYWGIRNWKKRRAGTGEALRHIIAAVGLRATSVAEDEALCLATLLDFDVQELLQHSKESKMEALWSMVREVPSDILLLNGETLSKKGLRWAPKSLLISSSNFNHEGRYSPLSVANSPMPTPLALVTRRGLLFGQSGILFNVGQGRIGTTFLLKDDERVHHSFQVNHRNEDQFQCGDCHINGEWRNIPVIDPMARYGTGKIAFISMSVLGADMIPGGDMRRVGILAAILRQDSGVLFGTKIASAMDDVARQDPSMPLGDTGILDTLYPEPETIGEFKGIPTLQGKDLVVHAVAGIKKPGTQIWCIE